MRALIHIGFIGFVSLQIFSAAAQADYQEIKAGQEVKIRKVSQQESQNIKNALISGNWNRTLGSSEDACSTFRASLPKDFIQGFVEVPENVRAKSPEKSRTIRIFYYGKLIPGKDPVIFYNGGPGSDSHGSYDILKSDRDYNNLSFLFIDQRGTGCSSLYPSEDGTDTLLRLANYGSRGIVLDSEVVREKILGASGAWKIFGQSYGGRIVHRYLTLKPDHIMSAHAHGFSIMTDSNEWLLLRIKSQTRVVEEYLKTYPGDAAILRKVQGLIPENRCFTDGELRICGPRVLDGLVMYLGFKYTWPYLHGTLSRMIRADGTLNDSAVNDFVRNIVFGIYGNNYVAGTVISLVDMTSAPMDFDTCNEPMKRLRDRGETPDTWILNECRLLAGMTNSKWDPLLRQMTQQSELLDETTLVDLQQSRAKNPQIPFYLYAGKMDVFVPIETFHEEIQTLGANVDFTLFENSGHEGFHTERKVWENLLKR